MLNLISHTHATAHIKYLDVIFVDSVLVGFQNKITFLSTWILQFQLLLSASSHLLSPPKNNEFNGV